MEDGEVKESSGAREEEEEEEEEEKEADEKLDDLEHMKEDEELENDGGASGNDDGNSYIPVVLKTVTIQKHCLTAKGFQLVLEKAREINPPFALYLGPPVKK
jgi:hypothetical protein